jgi:hypothetical protein
MHHFRAVMRYFSKLRIMEEQQMRAIKSNITPDIHI